MRENLHFYNIPENPKESNEESSHKVMDMLGLLGPTPDDTIFHVIPGTGKPNTMATLNEASTESREGVSHPSCPRPI